MKIESWLKAWLIFMILAACLSARLSYLSWETERKAEHDKCRLTTQDLDCDQRFPKEAEMLRKGMIEYEKKNKIIHKEEVRL